MAISRQRRGLLSIAALAALLLGSGAATATSSHVSTPHTARTLPGGYRHLVVIYQENHSFDNLYGHWGRVHGRWVRGLAGATAAHRTQVAQDGTPYGCLPQNDVNLTSPAPLPTLCTASSLPAPQQQSAFTNAPLIPSVGWSV